MTKSNYNKTFYAYLLNLLLNNALNHLIGLGEVLELQLQGLIMTSVVNGLDMQEAEVPVRRLQVVNGCLAFVE
jgi:hypothetical protein